MTYYLKVLVLTCAIGLALLWSTEAEAFWNSDNREADQAMEDSITKLQEQSNRVVGTPGIVNFFEKSMMRMLYELRDDPQYRTHTYIVTMTGKFVKVCNSVGFGINASIQFSNPEKTVRVSNGTRIQVPQPEPNGLFMPEGLSATYVLCSDIEGNIQPVYLEPNIIVSPFELE